MQFSIGDKVTIRERGARVVGTVILVHKNLRPDSAGSYYRVRVRWPNDFEKTHSGAQLEKVS